MRKAMICVTVMLALLQFWPMVFGPPRITTAEAATVTQTIVRPVPAVEIQKQIQSHKPEPAQSHAPQTCYKRYQAVYAACAKDDKSCRTKSGDQWDLCEATGFWPN